MTNNIFESFIADDLFRYDMVATVFNDLKESDKKCGIVRTRDQYEEELLEYFMEFDFAIGEFLDEEFEEESE